MALVEIGNLATTLLNQIFGQGNTPFSAVPAVLNPPAINAKPLPEDYFTPSSQANLGQTAAQEAGLFRVAQLPALFVAPQALQIQAAAPPAALNPAPLQPVAVPATPPPPAPQVVPPANPVTTTPSVQEQLQTLNITLAALGLNNADIQSLDRIASLVKDFNPDAYTRLVFQLESLAQQTAPRATATAATGRLP
jgi:hypothetical protein